MVSLSASYLSSRRPRRNLTLMRISNQGSINKEPNARLSSIHLHLLQLRSGIQEGSSRHENGRCQMCVVLVRQEKGSKKRWQPETKPKSYAELFIFLQWPKFPEGQEWVSGRAAKGGSRKISLANEKSKLGKGRGKSSRSSGSTGWKAKVALICNNLFDF